MQNSHQRGPQPLRCHAPEGDRIGADEDGQGAQRFSDAGERLVLIDASPSGRRRLRRREPRLEVRVAHLQPLLGAMRLGVEAADELAAMEDRQRVVAVHALRARGVDLDAVVESEQARHSVAMPQQ